MRSVPSAKTAPKNFDEYVATQPRNVQAILKRIRATIRRAAPAAEEIISYRMPAFRQQGVLVYFAAFRRHVGMYPPVRGDARLQRALEPYSGEKGNLQFPLDQPMPYALIARIVKLRLQQDAAGRGVRKEKVGMKKQSATKSARAPRAMAAAATSKTATAETQIKAFVEKYSPAIAAQLRAARRHMRALFPCGFELVYDNYNALAIGYATSERAGDAIVSIAGYPKWVTLFFLQGKSLADPHGLLSGAGSRVRSVRLDDAAQLGDARIAQLIERALAPHRAALRAAPKLATIVKSVSAKQRERRPPTGATPAKPSKRAR